MFIVMKWRSFISLASGFTLVCIILAVCGDMRSENLETVQVFAEKSATHILVIDAGHGGLDGGAVGIGGVLESDINLQIAKKLQNIAVLTGETVIMTREDYDIDYPDQTATIAAKKAYDQNTRITLINSLSDATVISIHQNTYSSTAPSGVQVFYRNTAYSKELATHMQGQLTAIFCENSRRVADEISSTIYLMNAIDKDAVLVECGFLSNPEECALLSDGDYQTKMAMGIFTAWRDTL